MKPFANSLFAWFFVIGLHAGPAEPSVAQNSTKAGPRLTVNAATRARIQLATQPLVSTNLAAELEGYGQVLDPAPLALLDAELDGAEAALIIARAQELREQALFDREQIVAKSDLEAAQLQVRAAETRSETALRRLATEWGEPFLQLSSTNRHALVRKLLRREVILLRVEVPAGESPPATPARARISTLDGVRERMAAFFSDAPTVDPRTLGRAFLFQVSGPDEALRPGATLTAHFATTDAAIAGVLIPRAAVVRHLGHAWVYLAGGDDSFERVPVALDRAVGLQWFSSAPLPTNAVVVVTGAQLLLSEELKSQLQGD